MLTQSEKNILSFIKPFAIEDRKVLMRDNFIDEKIKNMSIDEIRETVLSLGEKGYLCAKEFITGTVMIMEVYQKGLEYDQPADDLSSMPEFSFKRGNFETDIETKKYKYTTPIEHIKQYNAFETEEDKKKENEYKKQYDYRKPVEYKKQEEPVNTANYSDIEAASSYYINKNTDYLDIKKMIFADDRISESDQKKLLKLITLIETMTDSNVPLPKGAFVEYDDVICKYNWITDVIGRTLMNKYFLA